ncbi:MAG TPA: C10 family peptidase, partial [Bacteroidales bacterium]|nr:C10 family peptidase [Bacteroidales bacterium]
MARSHINNWLFIGPFSRDYKVYSKSYFKVIIVVLIGIAFGFTKSYSRPVDSLMVKKAAGTFIKSKFRGHQVASVSELKNNDHRTIGYLVNLKPSGFVVLSNDTEIYPIIYYSKKGKFDLKKSNQNIPLDFVKWDLQARERSIAQIKYKQTLSRNSTTWNNYLSGSGVSVQSNTQNTYGPLLTTKWNQNGFYAQYCPTDPKTNNRSYAGCVAAAASQILDYWQFPKKMTFNTADNYTSKGDDGNIAIPGDAGKYNFPTFSTLNSQLSSIKYDGSQTEIGYLEFGVGIKLRMGYSSKGSGAFQSAKFYRKLGYGSANRASWSTSYDKVVTNIKEGWPVQVAIDNGSEGHSVVFDGYDPSNSSFHVNMGWSGIDNGWYIPPYLDTPYKFHSMDDVVYNISPYAGWGQWGADAKNTQRTYYSMPEQNVSKWSVKTKLDRYSSKGLIVNKSSNVIVSNQPMDLKQSNHPSIMVIGPDGVKKSETYLTNENETITYPVQSHTGTIYVGTGTGRIYSINPNANSSKLIFQDPNQKEINNNLKIDSDGIIYATTMNNLYCINSNGNELWNLPAPSNCTYGINSPAIDVARNKVYLAYFNSSNNSSTLLTIDRLNGQILNQKTFSNINSPVTGIGTVSISKNGKVYFGVKTKLEELDPTNNYSLNTLYNNKYGLIINPPAIGKNGALYFSFWQNTKWYNVISLNPTNNSINWTIPIPSSNIGQYGSVSNIYVDNNYHICITID